MNSEGPTEDVAECQAGLRLTERLRLEPIDVRHAHDLWIIHNDRDVAAWYDGWEPTPQEAEERARQWGLGWTLFGVHKWMAYDRGTGELVGRGGLSRTPADEDWGRICRFLPEESWTAEVLTGPAGGRVHANWAEVGWALRRPCWGRGYATEIGRAGLDFAFNEMPGCRAGRATRATRPRVTGRRRGTTRAECGSKSGPTTGRFRPISIRSSMPDSHWSAFGNRIRMYRRGSF